MQSAIVRAFPQSRVHRIMSQSKNMNSESLITLCVVFTITRTQGMFVEQQGVYNILPEMRQQQQQQQRPRWVERLEPCSATCNGGYQRSVYDCFVGDRRVGERDCVAIPKPESDLKRCGQKPCSSPRITEANSPTWVLGEWGECSSKCGPGWRRRSARCVQQVGTYNTKEVDGKLCSGQEKPKDELGQCSSGISVPCPRFASPDVVCFEPPCKVAPRDPHWDQQGGNNNNNNNNKGDGGGCVKNNATAFLTLATLLMIYYYNFA